MFPVTESFFSPVVYPFRPQGLTAGGSRFVGRLNESNKHKQRIAANFSRAAHTYDSATQLQKQVAAQVRAFLPALSDGAMILDLGSGTGRETEVLASRYPEASVMGADIASGMLAYARERHCMPALSWCAADMEDMPFSGNAFDLVFSSLAVQWGDLADVLSEVARVLKPGGCFIFSSLLDGTMPELSAAWQSIDGFTHTNTFLSFLDMEAVIEQSVLKLDTFCQQEECLFYGDVKKLLKDLRGGGVNTVLSGRGGLLTRSKLLAFYEAYEQFRTESGLTLTYQVAYGSLYKSGNK
ncbi:Malonyl-[acyl-carrier protein] O-methyltransferase [invertebrate metagenome]|uniref:Malonyl-[acyl-carrier protein] O-methyltransferase n=1 Tax=invertebrate metagenome TaxID=1711999 RepID=A0A2H9T9F6_9ZZZZ